MIYVSRISLTLCNVPFRMCLSVEEARTMHDVISTALHTGVDNGPCIDKADAYETGYNYTIIQKASKFKTRTKWPLPKQFAGLTSFDISSAGCSKKRQIRIGHKSRTGLWYVCCNVINILTTIMTTGTVTYYIQGLVMHASRQGHRIPYHKEWRGTQRSFVVSDEIHG